MRAPISGISAGLRIIKGNTKSDSDYAKLFVLQPGDKNHDADLITIYIQDAELIHSLLNQYSNGELRWVDTFCNQIMDGREKVWVLERLIGLSSQQIPLEGETA